MYLLYHRLHAALCRPVGQCVADCIDSLNSLDCDGQLSTRVHELEPRCSHILGRYNSLPTCNSIRAVTITDESMWVMPGKPVDKPRPVQQH